jgi:hypothetical protein
MASLNTFGSILTYAIDLEARLRDYYESAGNGDRAAASDKRRTTLERVRRENVTEIKLEPIEGLDEANYDLNFDDTSAAGQQTIETVAAQFYDDVAPQMNVREAQRALERCAKQHRQLAAG